MATRESRLKQRKSRPVPRVRRSRGNVFADLRFDQQEAAHLRIRSALMAALRQLLIDRRLTQADAARLLEVTQPRVSDLVRGKIELFSIDSLVDMLVRAGVHVELRTRTPSR